MYMYPDAKEGSAGWGGGMWCVNAIVIEGWDIHF